MKSPAPRAIDLLAGIVGSNEPIDETSLALFDSLLDEVEQVASPALLHSRLVTSVASEPYAPLVPRLAELFDVGRDTVGRLLRKLSDATAWVEMAPGILLLHVDGGPRLAGAEVGFVRIAANQSFPPHRHLGEEVTVVLEGSYLDSRGATFGPGDRVANSRDSSHSFRAGPERDLLFAVVVFGIAFEGGPEVPS